MSRHELISEVQRLLEMGHSLQETGRKLGLTKGQVAGIHRRHILGIKHTVGAYARSGSTPVRQARMRTLAEAQRAAYRAQQQRAAAAEAERLALEQAAAAAAQAQRMAHILAMPVAHARSCQYPHGDPRAPDFHFCGERAKPGSPYCPDHHARCYIKRAA